MTISFVNGGAVVWTTASNPVVGYPAGAATDAIVAFVAGKPPAFVASQANYTLLGEVVSGSGGAAVDDGPTRNSGFLRNTSPTGTASDTWAVTGSPSPALLRTLRFARSGGVGWLRSYTGLVDTDETGTAVAATAPVTAGQYAAGDMVAITVVTKSDAIIHSSQALTIPGVVLDTPVWFARYLTTTGADGSAYSGYALVLSGSSTTGDATYTATSNVDGGAATTVSLVRLREDAGGATPTTVEPTGIDTAAAVGAVAAVLTITATLVGIPSGEAVGTPTVTVAGTSTLVTPDGVASGVTIGVPTVAGAVTVAPVGIGSSETLGVPAVTAMATVSLTGVESALAIGFPAASSVVTVTPDGIASTAALGDPFVTGITVVTPAGINTGEAFGLLELVSTAVDTSTWRDITITLTGPTGHPFTGGAPTRHPLTVTGPTGAPLTVTGPRS